MKVRISTRFVDDEALIADLARVAGECRTLTRARYDAEGAFHSATLVRRFGSWPEALALAGLESGRPDLGHPEETWLTNLYNMWVLLGRQPSYGDMRRPESRFSPEGYANRFGSWTAALLRFQSWIDTAGAEPPEAAAAPAPAARRRAPNLRTRWRVMQRDRFTCVACGASPATDPGVRLHVDHMDPFSRGGETDEANLQTLCEPCNLGKSNTTG